jgi:hypothetical protein
MGERFCCVMVRESTIEVVAGMSSELCAELQRRKSSARSNEGNLLRLTDDKYICNAR